MKKVGFPYKEHRPQFGWLAGWRVGWLAGWLADKTFGFDKQGQQISKGSRKGDQSASKKMITQKRHQQSIPQNRKLEKCK